MPDIPFSELVKRSVINNSSSTPFKIMVDSAEEFLAGILKDDKSITRDISERSASRNSDGEYVFTDGPDGNEIVIGIKDYLTRVKLRQYNAIFSLSDAMYGDKTRDIGRELVDTIKTVFLPWILVDVLIGLPVEEDVREEEMNSQFNFGGYTALPDNIAYEHVNVFREYIAGTVGIDVVKKTVNTISELPVRVPNDMDLPFPDLPFSGPPKVNAIETISGVFNLLFREKILIELVRTVGGLKHATTNVPNVKPLYESYVTSQRAEYETAYKSLIAKLYPGENATPQSSMGRTNTKHRYYEHKPVSQNTVFVVDTETRDKRHDSSTLVKCLRTTNARYRYSNDMVGHVLLQTIQFGRWWGGMTLETMTGCLGLITGILIDIETVDHAGFIPINVPLNSADIAGDVAVVYADGNFNPPIPKARDSRGEIPPIDLINRIKLTDYSGVVSANGVPFKKYGYLSFLHILLNAYDVVMVEKFQEKNGGDIQLDIDVYTKNSIRQTLDIMETSAIENIVSGLTTFATLCMVDGVWNVPKLNNFVMNLKSIDTVLHGGKNMGGASILFTPDFVINSDGFTTSPDITNIKIAGKHMMSFDIASPDIRQNMRISTADGTRYIPVIVRGGGASVVTRFIESVGDIFEDTYVSRGSLFTDLVGQAVVTASKPPRILGTMIGSGLETVARTASVVIPPIAIATNLVAIPAKYIFNVAAYDEMSQYSPFGLGQIFGRPIINGVQSVYLVVQLISLVGMGVVQPRIVRYINVPLRQLWSEFVGLLAKDTLSRDTDLVGVDYPTRFTYLKRVDRVAQYGDNNILDRSDAELIVKLVVNEYLYEVVWNSMKTEWYSYNQKIVDRLREFIETEGVSADIKSLFENFYFATLDAAVARENSIVGNSVRIMLSNIFADTNRDMLFPDYTNFIRVCKSRNKNTVNKETGEKVSYQTCTRISCERADLVVYENMFRKTFPDLDLEDIGLIAMVKGINQRLGGDIITGNNVLDTVIRNFPFELTDTSTDGSFQKSVIGLFDETIDEVKDLGERMLRNIMN